MERKGKRPMGNRILRGNPELDDAIQRDKKREIEEQERRKKAEDPLTSGTTFEQANYVTILPDEAMRPMVNIIQIVSAYKGACLTRWSWMC